ncbi:hypothetical protein SNL152K_1330 [Streptomyces sp. NL15-2K]|nr:hypothetical protein SNL152K_1330 [Streptomyces sp. NL15-2K]
MERPWRERSSGSGLGRPPQPSRRAHKVPLKPLTHFWPSSTF